MNKCSCNDGYWIIEEYDFSIDAEVVTLTLKCSKCSKRVFVDYERITEPEEMENLI